MEILSMMN